jgi:hypothetical protein
MTQPFFLIGKLFCLVGNYFMEFSGKRENQINKPLPIRYPKRGTIHPGLNYDVWKDPEEKRQEEEAKQRRRYENN